MKLGSFLKRSTRSINLVELEQLTGSYSQIKDVLVETRSIQVEKNSTFDDVHFRPSIRTPTRYIYWKTLTNFTLFSTLRYKAYMGAHICICVIRYTAMNTSIEVD